MEIVNVISINGHKYFICMVENGKEYIVHHRNAKVFRGTEKECKEFALKHPYGLTRKQRERMAFA